MAENNSLISERLYIPITAVEPVAVSGETISIPSGAAGTIVNAYTLRKPILKGTHDFVGGFGNTSLVLTSTTFTQEVPPSTPDSALGLGHYWVDYVTGMIHGKKADNVTSMTASYYVFQSVGGGGGGGGGTITFHDTQVFTSTDWVAGAGITTISLGYTPDAGSLHVYLGPGRVLPAAYDALYGYTVSGSSVIFPYELDPSYIVTIDGRVTTP